MYMQVCENVVGLESKITAAALAKLLKYVMLKRRAQDLAEIEDMVKVNMK